jgi:tetratricopeptide (TPR) repeat protein
VGEVEEAVRCYTRSINYDPSNHILYANRAMGYIKLEALEKAEEDCSKALQLDCTYVKAWSRRGLTRFKRGKYSLVSALCLCSLCLSFDHIHEVNSCSLHFMPPMLYLLFTY